MVAPWGSSPTEFFHVIKYSSLIIYFLRNSATTSGGKSDIILKKTVSMQNYSDDYEIFYPSIGMRDGCTCAGDVHVNPNYLHALGKTRCPSVATIKRRAYSYMLQLVTSISGQHRQITPRCVCVTFVHYVRSLQFSIDLSCHQFMLMHVRTCKIEMVDPCLLH